MANMICRAVMNLLESQHNSSLQLDGIPPLIPVAERYQFIELDAKDQ